MKFPFSLLICLFLASNANAETYCAKRDNIIQILHHKHAEEQSAIGLTTTGNQMLELFTSKKGDWTILLTRSNGTSCAMATGKRWTWSNILRKKKVEN